MAIHQASAFEFSMVGAGSLYGWLVSTERNDRDLDPFYESLYRAESVVGEIGDSEALAA